MDLINTTILLFLDYPDIINACKGVPDFFRLCNKPYFWALKADQDFNISATELLLVPGSNNKKRYEFIYNIKDPNKGLVKAAKLGILSLVKYYFKQGADLHDRGEWSLGWAANNGHLDVVKYLIEQGADLHAGDEFALRWAANNGHLDVVKYLVDVVNKGRASHVFLVEHGADLHVRDEEALRWAAANGHLDVIKYLVEHGANIHDRNDDALKRAAINGKLDVVKYLLEQGADLSVLLSNPNGYPKNIKIYLEQFL